MSTRLIIDLDDVAVVNGKEYRRVEFVGGSRKPASGSKKYTKVTSDVLPNANKRWTDEEREQLTKLVMAGRPVKEIATTMLRTESAVLGQIDRLPKQRAR